MILRLPQTLVATMASSYQQLLLCCYRLLVANPGGRFMIIDMGGGTVDMTIHQVESVVGQDLALSELTHRECLPEVMLILLAVS